MKLLIAGDTHGDVRNVQHKIDMAVEYGIQRIVVLGDFGLWWGHDGIEYLDYVNDAAKKVNRQIFAIPGNHENHEYWDALYKHGPKSRGWAYVRTNLLIAPKVLDFVWGNKQFMVAGGAVSIDKEDRLEYERVKGKKVWSPNEELTDAHVNEILATRFANGVKVDYLLTHDCSNATPWKHRLKADLDSQIHRQRIDKVLHAVKPSVHFHGHMHERYDWQNRVGGDNWTQTYGLECNRDNFSWGILDVGSGDFQWSSDVISAAEEGIYEIN